MAATAILEFWIFKILTVRRVKGVKLRQIIKFRGDRSNRCWNMAIFTRWRPFAILDVWCACLEHPRRAFGGLCHSVKFGWNRCGSFDNTQILVFFDFGLKTPIHAPFRGEGGIFPFKNGTRRSNPKRTVLWAIKHACRPRGSRWALEEEQSSIR